MIERLNPHVRTPPDPRMSRQLTHLSNDIRLGASTKSFESVVRDEQSDGDPCGVETFESETGDSLFDEDEVRSESDDSKNEFGEVVGFLSDGGVEDDELTLYSGVVERELEQHDSRADVVARHGLREGKETKTISTRDASRSRVVRNSPCERILW